MPGPALRAGRRHTGRRPAGGRRRSNGDLDTQYWVCQQGSESYLLSGCNFGWTCPAGEDRALECKQAGEGTQSCTCKNNKKGTEEGSFQAEGICGELPWQEITSQANTHCGWKIKDKSTKP